MNGLCPACRRPYDEKTIEYKIVSAEEYKAAAFRQKKKAQEQRQKDAQKREVESLDRKRLAGLRVIQKNLVYVVGLNPRIREEDLLQTLRGEQYFGQYGKIVKIVVSKGKEGGPGQGNQGMGVYVTFERKQDAANCIAAVDGSQNGDRILRAQYGTTKYCSAYLRNEQCSNKNCMFLHEPGEENDSFTRQDLSSMNVVSTQRPAQPVASSSAAPPERLHGQAQPPQPHPPLQQTPTPVAAASQPMRRQLSKDDTVSPTDSGDGSALPSTASWAAKGMQQQGGRTSQPTSVSTPSPRTNNATIPPQVREANKTESGRSSVQAVKRPPSQQSATLASQSTTSTPQPKPEPLDEFSQKFIDLVKSIRSPYFKFIFSKSVLTSEDYEAIVHMPPLFDSDGGTKRRIAREKEEEERRKREEEAQSALQLVEGQSDDQPESRRLQLGGEPEIAQDAGEGAGHGKPGIIGSQSQRQAIQPSQQQLLSSNSHHPVGMGAFGQSHALAGNISNLSINGRGLTPQQQQQLLLIKSGASQPGSFLEQFQSNNPSGIRMNTPSNSQLQQHQQLNLFQNQVQQLGSQGHTRQSSRYTFANDSSSASATVKPAINPQHMAQQATMMPTTSNFNSQQHQGQPPQHLANQFYTSSLQGPPPSLKSSGTPPISGGGMFGQGHGFGNSVGGGLGLGGSNAPNKDGSEFLREMLSRNRGAAGGAGSGQGADAGKREFMFPAFLNQYPSSSTPAPAPGLLGGLYGPQPGAYQDLGSQKQKRKGKKHRHANTSSSGGGGLVDLADPSILQARMQQQGGAGAGQGLFGGQGQGIIITIRRRVMAHSVIVLMMTILDALDDPVLKEISKSVDSLVDDDRQFGDAFLDSFTGKSPQARPLSMFLSHAHSTPPTGGRPQLNPLTETQNEPQRRHTAAHHFVAPALPIVPVAPTFAAAASRSLIQAQRQNASASGPAVATPETAGPKNKNKSVVIPVPAVPVASTKNSLPKTPTKTAVKLSAKLDVKNRASSKKGETTQKRGPPPPVKTNLGYGSQSRKVEKPTATAPSPVVSRPNTPSIRTPDSPAARPPKMLRLVSSTPKAESPSSAAGAIPTVLAKTPSRQSFAPSANRPGTPASEMISDNMSLTSASLSRANSPPLGSVVGTAPVKAKTKNQLKKERREAQKEKERKELEESLAKTPVEEVQHAPVVGRLKKKQRQPDTDGSTPVPSRPASPVSKEKESEAATLISTPVVAPTPTTKDRDTKKDKPRDKPKEEKPKGEKPKGEKPGEEKKFVLKSYASSSLSTESTQKPGITAALVISELQSADKLYKNDLAFFKSVIGMNNRYEFIQEDFQNLDRKLAFSNEDQKRLSEGLPVRIPGAGDRVSSRILITPGGCFLRGLTPEQEQKYLALEKRISEDRTLGKWTPTRLGGENGFSMIQGRVVQTGPTAVGAGSTGSSTSLLSEAANKLRVGDALGYINQFVLPTLPANRDRSKDVHGYEFGDFSLKVAGDINETGKAPEPSRYTPYMPGSAAAFGSDVAGVMHGMASGGADTAADGALRKPLQLPSVPLLSADEAEKALFVARKETEALERKLNAVWKKNRRLVFGSGN
ncbi:MAG: transcriptional repressor general negative regulator of transcription subunit 4 [Geoglossum umbratile]|nr:MAG: transcriptional repressor general negative regulator of transcription subunit 4 [Geoglossum umbratile]